MGRRVVNKESLTPDEVAFLYNQLEAEAHSARWWEAMTAPVEPDGWTEVEEHLLHPHRERGESLRRWKFFSK